MCKYTDGSLILEDDKSKSLLEIIPDSYFARGEFEILSEEDKEIDIQAMKELIEFDENEMDLYDNYSIAVNRQKINELIKVVKQLDKKIK